MIREKVGAERQRSRATICQEEEVESLGEGEDGMMTVEEEQMPEEAARTAV